MSPNIETLLPVTHPYMEDYYEKAAYGQSLLKKSNITVISLVRNIGQILETNIENISSFFRSHCKTYRHIFFENDSSDNTKDVLQQFQSKYPDNIYVISENLNRKHFGPIKSQDRLKALAEYRNKAKSYASQFESDFIIILDMDFNSISLYGILNSFGWMESFDFISAVTGNSFEYKKGLYTQDPEYYNLWNYDSWAYRHTWWSDLQAALPAPKNTYDPMLWFGLWIPPVGCSPITVNSAFGGCGIYRSSIYFLADYDDKDCEHVCFHYNLSKQNPLFKLVLNPSQRMLFYL